MDVVAVARGVRAPVKARRGLYKKAPELPVPVGQQGAVPRWDMVKLKIWSWSRLTSESCTICRSMRCALAAQLAISGCREVLDAKLGKRSAVDDGASEERGRADFSVQPTFLRISVHQNGCRRRPLIIKPFFRTSCPGRSGVGGALGSIENNRSVVGRRSAFPLQLGSVHL